MTRAEERSREIARLRLQPGVMTRLWDAIDRMEPGYTYKVQTEKNGRRRTIEGQLDSIESGVLTLDQDGRKGRVRVEDVILITVFPHD